MQPCQLAPLNRLPQCWLDRGHLHVQRVHGFGPINVEGGCLDVQLVQAPRSSVAAVVGHVTQQGPEGAKLADSCQDLTVVIAILWHKVLGYRSTALVGLLSAIERQSCRWTSSS